MASRLTHIQCGTALTRKRVDNMRPQTFRNSVLKGGKVEKMLGWTKDETDVDMEKGERTKTKSLCADLKRVSASER